MRKTVLVTCCSGMGVVVDEAVRRGFEAAKQLSGSKQTGIGQ